MRNRVASAILFAALVAMPVWAGKGKGGKGGGHSSVAGNSAAGKIGGGPSGGAVPETMSGYHSSAGYGSLYGAGYNGWTRNGWHDGQWHAVPMLNDPMLFKESSNGNNWRGYPYSYDGASERAAYEHSSWDLTSGYPYGSSYHGPYRPAEDYGSYPVGYSAPIGRRGSVTSASGSETQLIEENVARRRAQEAQRNGGSPQSATPAFSGQP